MHNSTVKKSTRLQVAFWFLITKVPMCFYLFPGASNVPVRQVKPVSVWTQSEVCKWLKKHLPEPQTHYVDLFVQHDITGEF